MTADLETHIKTFAKQVAEPNYKNLDQILLDGVQLGSLGSLEFLKEMPHLELLSLNFCKVQKLDSPFPAGCTIQRLELSDNPLGPEDFAQLANLEKLTELHLNENRIETAKDLAALKTLSQLKMLYLLETELAKKADYRKDLFELLPQLEIIDGQNKLGEEIDMSDSDESDSDEDEENSEEDALDELEEGDEDEDSDEQDSDDSAEQDSDEEEDEEEDEEDDAEEPAAKKAKTTN